MADDAGNVDPSELIKRWRDRWGEMPSEENNLFGRVYAPKSLEQLMLLFGQLAMLDIGAWRGQANSSWKLDSSLVRRWRQERSFMGPAYPLDEARLRTHEKALIERTREAGFLEPRSELEQFARLQHHGGATRLLDCTQNSLVALWFASQGPIDRSGILVGFRLGSERALKLDTPRLEASMESILEEANGRLLWWKPRQSNPRIAAQ